MPIYSNKLDIFENKFTVIGSFLNDIYAKNLQNYLNDKNIILELEVGMGSFYYI